MKFLQELVRFNRLDDEQEDDLLGDERLGDALDTITGPDISDDIEADLPTDGEVPTGDEGNESDFENLIDDEGDAGEEPQTDEPTEPEDPDRQGLIRTVNKAHLVYKRKTDDGTYDEMWMYNITNLRDEMSVRKAILSGTDIPYTRSHSPDGSQSYELWTAGNAEMMLIKGLPQ